MDKSAPQKLSEPETKSSGLVPLIKKESQDSSLIRQDSSPQSKRDIESFPRSGSVSDPEAEIVSSARSVKVQEDISEDRMLDIAE